MNKLQKELQELEGCSFQPNLNPNSVKMIKSHIPIFKRKLPEKKEIIMIPDEEEIIEEIIDPNKPKRKLNENFYEE